MTKRTNVLIVGSGGREHALAWKLKQSPRIGDLCVAPGNGGSHRIAERVPIPVANHQKLVEFAKRHGVDLVVIGPDNPLADGIVDVFQSHGIPTFGPTQRAARIESSKIFSKELMRDAGIPTADFETFSDFRLARKYLESIPLPVVIKANGLALGKGVYVCADHSEAEHALNLLMNERIHGDAGTRVVIEQFLEGHELSVHALTDGANALLFPGSRDFKRLRDRDHGPNTGGMGCVASGRFAEMQMDDIRKRIVDPALRALREGGRPFVGCLYPGLMLTRNGPVVLEFNARFGDPETQCYMRILKSDLLDLIEACLNGTVAATTAEWDAKACVAVTLASEGYPSNPVTGRIIRGIETAEAMPEVVLFHAGTVYDPAKKEWRTAGGRVLTVTATGATFKEARSRAYDAVRCIHFDGMQYRTDIGF